jgi:phosphorylase kinase alpha/beta subunit
MAFVFHNAALERLHRDDAYGPEDVREVAMVLAEHGVLDVTALPTGLYPASSAALRPTSGYDRVWVRDNVFVAYSRWHAGDADAAAGVANALLAFYRKYRHRLEPDAGSEPPAGGRARPHVRFDGARLEELADETWPHAQNDALGYCLWLAARLARLGALPVASWHVQIMKALADYFADISYWNDEDNGHWEETKKRSASSIGVVVAALQEWVWLLTQHGALADRVSRSSMMERASMSLARGREALDAILPSEGVQPGDGRARRYDGALLFLLYPLDIVQGEMAQQIADDVVSHLQGEIGIRRYPGDSYWAPDYDSRLPEEDWTRDYSNDLASRNRLLERPGDEAQWCIFDPVLSAWYGQRYQTTGDAADRAAQARHFNRSMAQVTEDWRCPELYYLKSGVFRPNPHTPLLWTQANLQLALTTLRATAEEAD